MGYLFALMLAALGGLIFFKKKDNSEAVKGNEETKAKVLDLQKFIDKDNVDVITEEQLRAKLADALKDEKNAAVTKDDLLDFLNKPSDDK